MLLCDHCGYGVLSSPPSDQELVDYYRTVYWSQRSHVTESVSTGSYASDPRAASQVAFAEEYLAQDRVENILEIGAGAASASLLLRDRLEPRPTIHVCEPGAQWEAHYREMGIVPVAPFFPFESSELYSYIHTSHWLEHVTDAGRTVDEIRGMLAANGLVFVEVPNINLDYWRFPGFDTPHVQFFSPDSLRALFTQRGFECLRLGEFGLTWPERHAGVHCTPNRFGANEEGFWLRALFQKQSE